MNFQEFVDKIFKHLQTLELNSPAYLKALLSYSSVLEKLFPQEFKVKLDTLEISSLMTTMVSTAGEMIKQSDSFNLNPNTLTIEVNLGDESISAPLVDLQEYLKQDLNLTPDTPDYLIALSYLSRTENFELFQITQAIVLK